MDQHRFDDFARTMATGVSRRTVLKWLGTGSAAGISFAVTRSNADAQCTGGDLGDPCEMVEGSCCAPYTCFEGFCDNPSGCASGGETCEMVEGSCCPPYTCFEAICDIPRGCVGEGDPCVDNFPCCEDEGLACVDGICTVPTQDVVVTDFPATGTGQPQGNSWFGVALAGGAAVVAGRLIRDQKRSEL